METRIHTQIRVDVWYIVIAPRKDRRGYIENRIETRRLQTIGQTPTAKKAKGLERKMLVMMEETVNDARTRIQTYGDSSTDNKNYIIDIYVRSNDSADFTETMHFTFPATCNPFDMMYSVLDAMADNLNNKNAPYDAYWSCRKLAISLYRMRN